MSNNIAVIATGGKQYLVEPEKVIKIEKIEGNVGDSVNFSEVLVVSKNDQVSLGKPTVEGASVIGEILKQGRHKKVVGVRFKPKKRSKSAFGHRQMFTEVKIKEIK